MLTSGLFSLPTLCFTAITLAFILLVKSLVKPTYPSNIPPFPVRPYPILGHLPYVMKGQRVKIQEWRKIAGDIFSLYIGSRLYVVINERKLIREALVANADALSNRPPMLHFEGSTSGLLFSNGSLWKEQRTTSVSILRSFGVGKSSLASKISEEISEYLKALAQLGGRPEDVSMLTRTSVSNNICSIMVGKRFDYHDPFLIAFLESFDKQVRAAENLSPVIVWPWLRHIPGNFLDSKTLNREAHVVIEQF
ncbi:cytochrome p450 ii f2-like protein ii, partial [Plakobranchus ocellatus]